MKLYCSLGLVIALSPSAYAQNQTTSKVGKVRTVEEKQLTQDDIAAQWKKNNEVALAALRTDRTEDWQQAFSSLASKENATMMVNIGTGVYGRPRVLYSGKKQGAATMRAVAGVTRKIWKQKNGVQVFSQPKGRPDYSGSVLSVVSWMDGLKDEDIQKLTKYGLVLGQVPPLVRADLLRLLDGDDMQFVLLGNFDKAAVQLVLKPVIVYPSGDAGDISTFPVTASKYFVTPYIPKVDQKELKLDFEPLEEAPKGALDFGAGAILPLSEVLQKASATFGQPITSDQSPQNKIFVSGSYTLDSFKDALALLSPVEVKITEAEKRKAVIVELRTKLMQSVWKDFANTQIDTSWMLDAAKNRAGVSSVEDLKKFEKEFGTTENLPASWFVENKATTFGELAKTRPGLDALLKDSSLSGDLAATFSLDMVVRISMAGTHERTSGTLVGDGKVLVQTAENRTGFSLFTR